MLFIAELERKQVGIAPDEPNSHCLANNRRKSGIRLHDIVGIDDPQPALLVVVLPNVVLPSDTRDGPGRCEAVAGAACWVQRAAYWLSHTYNAAMESSDQQGVLRQNGAFATTRWSIVVDAGHQSSPDSRRALESLCGAYWHPLYAYVRRRVPDANEAQDLTQAFFAELLEKNYVGSATPERGRFRSFLLTAFKHFLAKEWDKAKAQKRGGGRAPISLDFETADSSLRVEPAAGLTAEQFYDQQWAIALLGQIMERLKGEFAGARKARQFEELKAFIIGDHAGTTYSQPAAVLNVTEAAAKKAASRMRRRYRELLREEIARTVAGPDEIEDEIRNLFAILSL